MNYFIRNTFEDFVRWYKHIVPFALADLKQFKIGKSSIIYHEDYENAIRIKAQICDIEAQLDSKHIKFFEEVLIKRRPVYISREEYDLRKDIYEIWRIVCFPKGKSQFKTINPVLLGGELRRRRTERGISARQVAGLLEVSENTLYSYEEGIRMIRVDTFYKLCQIYGTLLDEILRKVAL